MVFSVTVEMFNIRIRKKRDSWKPPADDAWIGSRKSTHGG